MLWRKAAGVCQSVCQGGGDPGFRNSQLKMTGLRICTYTQSSGKPGAQPCNESGSGNPIGLQWDLGRDMRGWPGSEAGIPAVVWAPHSHWEAQLHGFDIWLQLCSHPKEEEAAGTVALACGAPEPPLWA